MTVWAADAFILLNGSWFLIMKKEKKNTEFFFDSSYFEYDRAVLFTAFG